MVLSLVVIRFEIDDEFPLLNHLDYIAEAYKQSEARRIKSNRQYPKISLENSSSKETFAGVRTCDKLCIETVVATGCDNVKEPEVKMTSKSSEASSNHLLYSDAVRASVKDDSVQQAAEATVDKIPYFSGNPSVEITKGVLHLYKLDDLSSHDDTHRSELLCMLSVPAKMTCPDLLDFIAPLGKNIDHIRIIRDSTPNLYMVLLKFKEQKMTDEFYHSFNGKAYNSLEPEVCHLVYICKVESHKSSEGAYLPLEGATELPTCHICLERMDESVEGILTVLCNHSFHGSCLAKWQDSSCPVCRCCQTTEPVPDNKCFTCDSKESLWICLICGHIGCGRYKEGHAHWHFRETQHTYSMELETQRVWDYTGDNYVHRLVQNKSDGKLVEFDVPPNQIGDVEKLDSITLEYTYLLTSQLESQRLYFEEKIAFVEQDAFQQVENAVKKATNALEDCKKIEGLFSESEKERKSIEKKHSQATAKLKKIEKELTEERELNGFLRENQKVWQDKVSSLEKRMSELEEKRRKEIEDLQGQVTDLMAHFEAQTAIGQATPELQQEMRDGHVYVNETQQRKTGSKTRKKHK